MNNTGFLFFPDTRCFPERVAPLYPIVEKLIFYQPGIIFAPGQTDICHTHITNWCVPRIPFLFPQETEKKLAALLSELERSGGDFARQLGAAMIFAKKERANGIEQSAHMLAASLAGGTSFFDPDDANRLDQAWNAWLTMELAALHDTQQAEIALELAKVEAKRKQMTAMLQGEEVDTSRPITPPTPSTSHPTRLAAWTSLLLMDDTAPQLLVTDSQEAVDGLLEAMPEPVTLMQKPSLSLQLPDILPDHQDETEAFRQKTSSFRKLLPAYLKNENRDKDAVADTWQRLLQQDGRPIPCAGTLDCYLLDGIDLKTLFRKAFLTNIELRPGTGAAICHLRSTPS